MSTLWTPDGERKVPPASDEQAAPASGDASEPDLTPEQQEQARALAKELAEARARILATEASTVVANHAFGIYELAAIHLTADEPKLSEAQVAIDALAALVNGLKGRLGEVESTLVDALQQAQLLYVQRVGAAEPTAGGGSSDAGTADAGDPDGA
ncbi:MAG: hypothetical protein OES24_17520 [Acidimicrobiia bacterium]|nr:hypothetical protein [Acidimicrobiia bacterium]